MSNNFISSIDQLIKSGKFEEAEEICTKWIDKNENNTTAFSKLGEIYLIQGKEIESQFFFEKAVKMDKHNYYAIISLADLYVSAGETQSAEKYIVEIISTSFSNINDVICLAITAEKMKKYEVAENICKILNARFPNNIEVKEIIKRIENYYSLFYVVQPQINNESKLGKYLYELIDTYNPKVILDIGAATGLGSTTIIAESVKYLNLNSKIYAIEAQEKTFNKLKINIAEYSFVEPIWGTFINVKTIPSWETVSSDIKTYGKVLLENYSENEIKNWYESSVSILNMLSREQKVIKEIIQEEIFDLVFFDSGEFFAKEELKEFINKTNIVVLDDINTYKNSLNHNYLLNHPDWMQVKCYKNERNGWSAFKRKDFLVRSNTNNNELIKSVYVSDEIEIFYGKNATDMLDNNNDMNYLTDKGIITVDKNRWSKAQKYEKKTWMERSLESSDDRNLEHKIRFNNYAALKNFKFENVIELGCGPFTNLRLILPLQQSVKSVTLLDPLILEYLQHPHCTYKNSVLAGHKVQIINSTIEEFMPENKYDLVVMNNVLEHCFNIPKIFEGLLSMLKDGGIFVFTDVAFSEETVKKIVEKQYDAGHPIRLTKKYLNEFLSKNFKTIYEKSFSGLYEQPYRKDYYFIGECKSIVNSKTQQKSLPLKVDSPIIHFVYSGDPKNDQAIIAPNTITNKLYRFFEQKMVVRYYDLEDVNTPIDVKKNDIIIGHPHPDENTAIKRLFSKHVGSKYLLLPLHTRIPEINRYIKDVAEKADKVFLISGPYWVDNIEKTEFGYLKNKIIRIDNAIDSNLFPLLKNSFNSVGKRGLFVFGRSGREKGTKELFNLLLKIDCQVVIAGYYSNEDISMLNNRPNTKFLGSIKLNDKGVVDDIINTCDFFINMSVSDASPTTLLEAMSFGLIPITTPQCGYYYSSFILLSLDNEKYNILTVNNALNINEEALKILQKKNRDIIERNHNWDAFCNKIGEYIFSSPIQAHPITTKRKGIKVAEDYSVEKNLTQIDAESVFSKEINKIFTKIKPTKIIETGTYLGTGTTKIIASALKKLELGKNQFFSIEVNENNYKQAIQNITNDGLSNYVTLLHGLSLPRKMLPSIEEIDKSTVKEVEFDDIFVDHKENERAKLYYDETNFESVEDNMLEKCLISFEYKPDFILLDSGGHIGNLEFNYLIEKLRKDCIIALDDINHIKHKKSFLQIKSDPRFEIITSSEEKFGFCIAKFTYDSKIEVKTLTSIVKDKEIINCLICGSDKSSIVHPPDITRCNKCGFVFLKERPTQKWMENYYKNVYTVGIPDAAVTVAVPEDFNLLDTKDEYIAAQRKGLFNEAVAYYGKDIMGGTLVDIGCGWGALLHNARKSGMNVIGFEFINRNVQFAQDVLKLDVRQEQFTDSNIPENSVDIVTMSHVLEHVPDPLKLVKKIDYVLKPGGIFYCVVPNFYSLCSAYLGERWDWLDRNCHYSYFTVDSITNLFTKAHLDIVKYSTTGGDYGSKIPLQILKNKYPHKSNEELSLMLEELNKQNLGEEIRIIGKKPESTPTTNQEQDTKNILWIRTDAIGDSILASSMLKPLKEFYNEYKITVVCQNIVSELYEVSPFVDNIISFDKKKFVAEEEYRKEIILKLYSIKAEYAINSVFSRDVIADFLTLCTKTKIKIAHQGDLSNMLKEEWEKNNKSYSKLIPINSASLTELERHHDFLTGIGIECDNLTPSIWLTEEDHNYADKVFSENNLESKKTIALFAGAQYEVRIYNDYGKAINNYCNENGFEVVVLGSAKDHQVNQANIKDLTVKVVDLTGKTTVRQSAAILQKCAAAVGAETGLAHIACAVGTPNLILLGGGHFGRFMPYSNLTSIVSLPLECFGCNWQCKYRTTTCIKDIDHQVISFAMENMMTRNQNKTTVYLQSEYKYDFLGGLPKITGIENFLKGEFEIQVVELETADVTNNFTDNISEFKDEKYFIALNRLKELFNLNGTDLKQYANYEKQLFTEKNKLELLFENDSNNYAEDPFYNYLKGLFNENKKKFKASYENYLLSFKSGKNLRVLNKLAEVADKNFVIPQVYFLFKELFQRGIRSPEILEKINNWAEILNVKSENKLTQINYNIDLPSEYLNDLKINKKRPTISFVLPSKNRSKGLSSFLSSLDNACFGLSYEVLLYCGDELTEQYDKLIKEYNIKKIFFDKEIFGVQETFSWTKLMNHGFNHSEGQWIMYASDDIVLHPFACNFALQSVKDKTVGGVSFLHRNTIQDYDGFFKDYGFDIYGERPFINFGLIKKEAFQKVKGFDEALTFYSGDADLCWRIVDKGFKIIPSYYSLVEHINIEDATKELNSVKTYKIDTYVFFKKWLNQINQLKDKLLVKEHFFIKNIEQVKKHIFETSIKNNISIEKLLTVDKKYEQFIEPVVKTNDKSIKVSAIVSTYNSEKFFRGCLDDLINQTLYKKGELEIVIVNSGSQQNEDEIVKEYQDKHKNIKYVKTGRETIYEAWNRGIVVAKGTYITNANTDDRHKEDALEILANALDEKNNIALVYADSKVTDRENEEFETAPVTGLLLWPEFDRTNLFRICYIGPQPMWRKTLHKKYGYFDGVYKSAGDYDFWLRIVKLEKFEHINKILGLYLLSESSVEHVNQNISLKESEKARKKNWDSVSDLPPLSGTYLSHYNCSEYLHKSVKFSVVIPTYNRPESLKKALQSLTKQTYKNFEVIVVNDGQQEILSVLKEFEGQFNYQHVRNIMNRERSASRNNGIKVSRGKYITFLDDDDIFYPDHLLIISDNLSDSNSIVYTDAVRVVYEKTNEGYKIIDESVPYSIDYERNKLLVGNIAPINCFAIQREKLFEAGLFNETINVLEDWELLLRLSELTPFKHIKKITCEVSWKLDGSSTTSSKGYLFDKVRKQIYSKYDKEIKNIPNRNEIVNEFNRIWKNDFASGSSIVSIIALSFNQFEYTKSFVQSLLKFTKATYELILVDNGSNKETVDYLKELSTKNERIKVIFNEENFGFPKGVNQAIKVAKGKYILIANNDIIVTEGWLERMVEVAEVDNQIGLVGPISNSVSGVQFDKEATYPDIPKMHVYAKKNREKNAGQIFQFPRVAFLCTLIKKEVIEKIGGLDERFSPGNFEDDDFCLRAQIAGYKTVVAKDVFIHHFGSKSFTADGTKKYAERLEINKKIFVEKWGADPEEIWLRGKEYLNKNIFYPLDSDELSEIVQRAQVCIQDKEYGLALNYLQTVLENKKFNFDNSQTKIDSLLHLAGKICLIERKFEQAINYFQKELDNNYGSLRAYKGMGDALSALGEKEEAFKVYQKAHEQMDLAELTEIK